MRASEGVTGFIGKANGDRCRRYKTERVGRRSSAVCGKRFARPCVCVCDECALLAKVITLMLLRACCWKLLSLYYVYVARVQLGKAIKLLLNAKSHAVLLPSKLLQVSRWWTLSLFLVLQSLGKGKVNGLFGRLKKLLRHNNLAVETCAKPWSRELCLQEISLDFQV